MTERLHFHFSLSCIGEGNGNPLQYSCLENPRDHGARWAAFCGVGQSWTWLKQLSSSSNSGLREKKKNLMWLRLRTVEKKNKTFVLSSSLRTPDPSFLLGDTRLLINLPRNLLSFPPFLSKELCCQGKGASFSFHNYFLLFRRVVPKLLNQHVLLTFILRVSDPGAPNNSWRRLWDS